MADKPIRKKPTPRLRIEDLSAGEIRVLQDRLGVVLTHGHIAPQEPEESEHQACAFCGRTDGQFRQLFDASHYVTICMTCLETSDED